jgi:electron transport complex protein RnfB
MSDDLYERLRQFLDTFPGGFPATPTGVEIRILKKLFSPADAELFLKLRKEPEDLASIAARLGRPEAELGKELEDMARRGLVFRTRVEGRTRYQAYQFFVGIIEAQINRVDLELTQLVEEYFPFLGAVGLSLQTKQMRVIPAEKSLETGTTVAPYHFMRNLVRDEDLVAVAPCICRQMAETKGNRCEHTLETCLSFGDLAQFYLDNGVARRISKEELLGLLDKVEQEGLVLCTSNTQDLSVVCCCCKCCCGIVNGVRLLPESSLMVNIFYQSRIDGDLCSACGVCFERCPVGAITESDGAFQVLSEKCIGCGLCASSCPTGAISLAEVAGAKPPFKDHQELKTRVLMERGLL